MDQTGCKACRRDPELNRDVQTPRHRSVCVPGRCAAASWSASGQPGHRTDTARMAAALRQQRFASSALRSDLDDVSWTPWFERLRRVRTYPLGFRRARNEPTAHDRATNQNQGGTACRVSYEKHARLSQAGRFIALGSVSGGVVNAEVKLDPSLRLSPK